MTQPTASLRVRVDATNPGQFFACCGLFELASRLAHPAASATLAWFDSGRRFHLRNTPPLVEVINEVAAAEITALDPSDRARSPLKIEKPFDLHLDWWRYESRETGKLKTWAGQMSVLNIARDMCRSMKAVCNTPGFIDENMFDATSDANEGEPFYFDVCRALNSHRRDVGFSVDALKQASTSLRTLTRPAVEFLCLVGIQRARPRLARNDRGQERAYDYCTWTAPIPIELLPAAANGVLPAYGAAPFRFMNPSRTKDYRAFRPATPVEASR